MKSSSTATVRVPVGGAQGRRRAEADQRAAGLHRRRGVHDVAADRPLRARRVRADDRARVGERGEPLADRGVRRDLGVRDERAEAEAVRRPSSIAAELGDAVDRDERVRAAAPCPGARRRRGRCRPRPGARRRRSAASASSTVVAVAKRRHAHCPASQTRSGVIGSWRDARPDHLRDRVRDRARRRDARRLADALRALRPGVRRVGLDPVDRRSRGASEAVTSL